jgi:hypothetical protein
MPTLQQNPYEGTPPRPWICLWLRSRRGTVRCLRLLADTGNPFELIISSKDLDRFKHKRGQRVGTNFGIVTGGWLQVVVPDLHFEEKVIGFASDRVVEAATASSPHFDGLAGLPLLRKFQFGGDAGWFWLRPARKRRQISS